MKTTNFKVTPSPDSSELVKGLSKEFNSLHELVTKYSKSSDLGNTSFYFCVFLFLLFVSVGCSELKRYADGDSSISIGNNGYVIHTRFVLGGVNLVYTDSTKNTDSLETILKRHASLIKSNRYNFELFNKHKQSYIETLRDKLWLKSFYFILILISAIAYTLIIGGLISRKSNKVIKHFNLIYNDFKFLKDHNYKLETENLELNNKQLILEQKIIVLDRNLNTLEKNIKVKKEQIQRNKNYIERLKKQNEKLKENK